MVLFYLFCFGDINGLFFFFFFSSRRRHTRLTCDWSQTCALPICLFAFELERLRTLRGREPLSSLFQRRADGRPSPLLDFVACGLLFLPVIPLMLMSPTWGLRWDFNWELNGKLSGLIFVIEV